MPRLESGFQRMLRDEVSLLKRNGERINNIKASVQSSMIFTDDVSIAIIEGDQFIRVLPNGVEERYTVIDSGYQSGLSSMAPHYQSKVRKETGLPNRQDHPTQNIGMYVQGNVSHSNIQSIGVSNEQVSQIVNNPELLKVEVENAINRLIDAVKPELDTRELIEYIKLTEELKQLLLSDEKTKNPSLLKSLIASLSLLDSANGTLDLVYKVWPYLLPLIAFSSEIYAKMG